MLNFVLTLEILTTKIPRSICYISTIALTLIAYLLSNHNPIFNPSELPLFNFESNIPFLGWTTWIYLSIFAFVFVAIMIIPKEIFGRIVIIGGIEVFLHIIIFILFPTIYPRPEISGGALLDLFQFFDTPINCFPSLHVSGPVLLTLVIWQYKCKTIGTLLGIWTIAITISTLTTKQHYTIDLIGSYVLSYITYRAILLDNKP